MIMIRQLNMFWIESMYNTVVLFFYYYVFSTLIHLNPFSLGFHPPIEGEKISFTLLCIFLSVASVKAIGRITRYYVHEDKATHGHEVFYTPSHRH